MKAARSTVRFSVLAIAVAMAGCGTTPETGNKAPVTNAGPQTMAAKKDALGAYDPVDGTFWLASAGSTDTRAIRFGSPKMTPVVGDWNGDGATSLGLYQPSDGSFFLTDKLEPGDASMVFTFGVANMRHIVGLSLIHI